MAALGIGGEWAVGSSLLSETWPRRWRAWIAAVLQTGVNLGVLLACLATFLLAAYPHKYVFLVGILPALIVYWIRRSVPEPAEWTECARMPRRTDIHTILIIGSGPIVIGQGCEFDYSGVQACRALREEGYRIVLINSNPATIMTDPEFADATYIEPITPEAVEKILERESARARPIDALLPTLGGQTGLNTGMACFDKGILTKYGVKMIGADREAIFRGEDRQVFKDLMIQDRPEGPAQRRRAQHGRGAQGARRHRPAADHPPGVHARRHGRRHRLQRRGVRNDRPARPRRFAGHRGAHRAVGDRLEGIRDGGDARQERQRRHHLLDRKPRPDGRAHRRQITVAPIQTLTDKEYQRMRDAAIAVIRAVGVETGGSNIQFAINPDNGEMVVVEMNPRVSRSSRWRRKRPATRSPRSREAGGGLHAGRAAELHHETSERNGIALGKCARAQA
jgi:hypothetical protein